MMAASGPIRSPGRPMDIALSGLPRGPGVPDETYTVRPVGRVENGVEAVEDTSGATLRERRSTIVVLPAFEEALTNFDERVGVGDEHEGEGLVDVVFLFDGVDEDDVELASTSSQGLTAAGVGGVFSRRTFERPNRLGLTTVRVVARDGRRLEVEGLDALDGTPVLDIKPHVRWREELGVEE